MTTSRRVITNRRVSTGYDIDADFIVRGVSSRSSARFRRGTRVGGPDSRLASDGRSVVRSVRTPSGECDQVNLILSLLLVSSFSMDGVKSTIQKYLGRPYVWGSAGLKTFDCSGFIWRVMSDNGILMKRTTARKFYMILPEVREDEKWKFGTIVFFDNLKHVGIIDSSESFYHAQVSRGTNRSVMNPFWRRQICGFRRMPAAPQ